jgi:hypothetical protein
MEYENKYKYHTKYFYSALQINFAPFEAEARLNVI